MAFWDECSDFIFQILFTAIFDHGIDVNGLTDLLSCDRQSGLNECLVPVESHKALLFKSNFRALKNIIKYH